MVHVVHPWNEGVDLTLLSGDASRRQRVPNILFICEGFEDTAADRNAFNRIVNVVVDGLRKNHLIDPWPMLHASVNFWSAFTPGRQAAATHRSEVYIKDANAQNAPYFDVPQPDAPKASDLKWTVAQLVHQIGLPVPADAATGITTLLPRAAGALRRPHHRERDQRLVRGLAAARQPPPPEARRDSALCFTARRPAPCPDPAG